MMDLGFNLTYTVPLAERQPLDSPVAARVVMFTGKMLQGSRADMQAQARALGATVLTSVSKNLQILVTGEKASAAKVKKARALGAEVVSEAEWLAQLRSTI